MLGIKNQLKFIVLIDIMFKKIKVKKMTIEEIIYKEENKSLNFIDKKLSDFHANILIKKNINYEVCIELFVNEKKIYNEIFILEKLTENLDDMHIKSLMIILLNNRIFKIALLDMCMNNRDVGLLKQYDLSKEQKKEIIEVINQTETISLCVFNFIKSINGFEDVYMIFESNSNIDINKIEEETLIKIFSNIDIEDIPKESYKYSNKNVFNKKAFKFYLEKILEDKINKKITLKDIIELKNKLNLDKNYSEDECFILIKKIFVKLYPYNNFTREYKKEIELEHIQEEYGIIEDLLSLMENEVNEKEYLQKILKVVGLQINMLKVNQRLIDLNEKNINIILNHCKKNNLRVVLREKYFYKLLDGNIKLKQKKELIDLIFEDYEENDPIIKKVMEEYQLKEQLKYF